jgi:uncharacterized protein (TIGR02246 family)
MLSRALIAAAVVAAAWQSASARPLQQSCAPVDQAILETQFTRFTTAWASGDAEKVADLFAPDAVLLATVSNTPRTTRAGIADYFEHFLQGKPVAHLDTSAIRLSCNMAARFGTWTIDLTDPVTGVKSQVATRYTFVYKFERGQWWIDHLHSSKMPETGAAH